MPNRKMCISILYCYVISYLEILEEGLESQFVSPIGNSQTPQRISARVIRELSVLISMTAGGQSGRGECFRIPSFEMLTDSM